MVNPVVDTHNERTLLEGILYYIAILLKYKLMIILGTTSAAVSILIFSIISLKLPAEISPLPNTYRAYAVVLFQEGGGNATMSTMLSAFGVESSGGGASNSQLAMEILRSRLFIDKIVDEFNIIEKLQIEENPLANSRQYILANSNYSFNRDSGALTISFVDIDPDFASQLVNFEVNLLEEWFLNKGVSIRSQEISLMEEKINELKKEISKIEGDIESFQKEYGVLDISELAIAQSTMLTDLRTRLNQVELEISDYSEYSTIEDPALTTFKSRRSNIITQIRRIEDGYISSDGRRMPSQAELPQLSLTFAHMIAELTLKNQLYATLSERYEVTKLVAAESGAFSVLEYAEIPEEKEGPSRGQLCIKVTFGTFTGMIVLAFILNMIKNIANDPKNKKKLKGEA